VSFVHFRCAASKAKDGGIAHVMNSFTWNKSQNLPRLETGGRGNGKKQPSKQNWSSSAKQDMDITLSDVVMNFGPAAEG
jgi:hypothetical protein